MPVHSAPHSHDLTKVRSIFAFSLHAHHPNMFVECLILVTILIVLISRCCIRIIYGSNDEPKCETRRWKMHRNDHSNKEKGENHMGRDRGKSRLILHQSYRGCCCFFLLLFISLSFVIFALFLARAASFFFLRTILVFIYSIYSSTHVRVLIDGGHRRWDRVMHWTL